MSAERVFLHDIASPITTAQLNLENAAALIQESGQETPELLNLIKSSIRQMEKAGLLIRKRREEVKAGMES